GGARREHRRRHDQRRQPTNEESRPNRGTLRIASAPAALISDGSLGNRGSFLPGLDSPRLGPGCAPHWWPEKLSAFHSPSMRWTSWWNAEMRGGMVRDNDLGGRDRPERGLLLEFIADRPGVPTLSSPGVADALAMGAVAGIQSGMIVGLGTGRAASRAIRALGQRAAAENLELRCVATSRASAELAGQLGLGVEPMEGVEVVDYLFDGADEVDPQLRMIKGRGGAMTREKIVAQASARRVYLVQTSKLVQRLGEHAPLPIEVLRFGLASTRRALRGLGLGGPLRLTDGGA